MLIYMKKLRNNMKVISFAINEEEYAILKQYVEESDTKIYTFAKSAVINELERVTGFKYNKSTKNHSIL